MPFYERKSREGHARPPAVAAAKLGIVGLAAGRCLALIPTGEDENSWCATPQPPVPLLFLVRGALGSVFFDGAGVHLCALLLGILASSKLSKRVEMSTSQRGHMINAPISVLALDRFTVVANKQSLRVRLRAPAGGMGIVCCQYSLISSRGAQLWKK